MNIYKLAVFGEENNSKYRLGTVEFYIEGEACSVIFNHSFPLTPSLTVMNPTSGKHNQQTILYSMPQPFTIEEGRRVWQYIVSNFEAERVDK
jgi:hypothetical protein